MNPMFEELRVAIPQSNIFAHDCIRRADWFYAQGLPEQAARTLYDLVVYGGLKTKEKLTVKSTIVELRRV